MGINVEWSQGGGIERNLFLLTKDLLKGSLFFIENMSIFYLPHIHRLPIYRIHLGYEY